jgi:peptidyl-prolyl cis-trans isomerase B (cyclophilin B)
VGSLRYLATARAGECGEFTALLEGIAPGASLRALGVRPGGESSDFGPPATVTRSEAPEARVETPYGPFVMRLLPGVAPEHVRYFLETAAAGAYDGTLFHRVVPGQVVVGGDPLTRDPAHPEQHGRGGLGMLRAEFSDRCFARGVVAAVRCPSNCDTAGSQFFVCLADRPELNGHYTVFGEVVAGMEVLDRIGGVPLDGERPMARIPMRVQAPAQ